MAKFNEAVKEFRESVGQSPEALALLLQISPDEYASLENDWTPPDDVLQRVCALFKWNYNDIKRMVTHTPSLGTPSGAASQETTHAIPRSSDSEAQSSFHELLQDARSRVGQSSTGIAMLLNISVEYYESFEQDTVPPDDLVRKICSLFGWNYREVRQNLINRSTPRVVPRQPPLAVKDLKTLLPKKEFKPLSTDGESTESLGNRLYRARMEMRQSPSAIALLLDVSEEYYLQLESGLIPDPELLKRVAALFRWNYNDLRLLVSNENILQFQPTVTKIEATTTPHTHKFRSLQEEISQYWNELDSGQQETLITQLELLRDTAKKLSKS